MPKTLEKLKAEYLLLQKQRGDKIAAIEKEFAPLISKAVQSLCNACDHSLVVEFRMEDSKKKARLCCICGIYKGIGKRPRILKSKPFCVVVIPAGGDGQEGLLLEMLVETWTQLPLPELRAEAERLREEQKGGE